MRLALISLAVGLGLAQTACSGDGGDTGAEVSNVSSCVETGASLSMDETSALGFSGAELLAAAEGSWSESMVWARGGGAGLTISVSHAGGDATFFDAESAPSGDGVSPTLAAWCPDRLEVEAQIGFVTDDGGFDEIWSVPLVADEDGGLSSVRFSVDLEPAAMGGDRDLLADVQSSDYDEARFWVYGVFEDGAAIGEISGQASGEEECGDDEACVSWAEQISVGYWPADLE